MPNTLEENVNRVKAAKTAIANAITAKGGTVGANDGLEDFAADIATIPSGGGEYNAEFGNTPTEFGMRNIVSVNIPNGITSIGSSAFSNCSKLTSVNIPNSVTSIGNTVFNACIGLTSIVIPESVETIGGSTFNGCSALTTINIYKEEDAISGAPWGAANAQVNWLRQNRYTSVVNEISSGTTLTTSVSCTVGDLVVATFVIRGDTYTISNDWTLLGLSEVVGTFNQRTGMAYKIATSATESLTVTQDSSIRIYTNLVAITGGSVETFSGFTTQATGSSITMNRPSGLVIWGVSSSLWSTATPYLPWEISDTNDIKAIQLPTSTQPRCLTALDQGNDSTVTFRYSPDLTGDAGLAAASLTITGIDNFWYYDEPQT